MTFLKYWPELGAMFTLRKINAYLKKKKKETPPVFPSEKKKKRKIEDKRKIAFVHLPLFFKPRLAMAGGGGRPEGGEKQMEMMKKGGLMSHIQDR